MVEKLKAEEYSVIITYDVNQAKEVGHEQVPALYDQVIGEFYFKQ